MVSKSMVKVYINSSGGNYISTLAIGREYLERWETFSLPYWKAYCSKHNIGLIALVEPFLDPGKKRNDWQKLLVGRAIRESGLHAERVCFVDYDVVPNPFSENIFNQLAETKIGFVSQRSGLPHGSVDRLLRHIAIHRNRSSGGAYPLDSYLTRPPEAIFRDHGLYEHADYGCGGMFLFNMQMHSEYLEEVFFSYTSQSRLISNAGEEVYLNHHIQIRDDFEWLSYEWHTLWWYEMAWFYPWLYERSSRSSENVKQAICATLLRSNFLHFVGSWEKWAWGYLAQIDYSSFLNELRDLNEYYKAELTAPAFGQIFPVESKETKLISR